MASTVIRGGLSALVKLGSTDSEGVSKRSTFRSWCTCDNGNPAHMLDFVRDFMGADDEILFILERDINRNVVVYRPSFTATGDLDRNSMARASWLLVPREADLEHTTISMADEELVEEDLSVLEKYAYAVTVLDEFTFALAALPDTPLVLTRNTNGKWCVRIEIESQWWTLQRILVHTTPMAFNMFPAVSEIHFDVQENGRTAQFYYATQ